jgi:hypothetical protein
MLFPNRVRGFDPLYLVARRHSDVGQDSIRAESVDSSQELFGVAHTRHHLNLPGILEQAPGALADKVVVLSDDDAQPRRHDRSPVRGSCARNCVP